jgi:uncharacterized membrane protein YeaQ/YmgE (transglycosylase-associated protein family)
LSILHILLMLAIGALAGWLAGQIMKGRGFGLLGNLVVGIIGAFVGGHLLPYIGLGALGLVGSLISATLGAIIFLFLVGLIKRL